MAPVMQVPGAGGNEAAGAEAVDGEDGSGTGNKKHHLTDAEQFQIDLDSIPADLQRYDVQADGVTPCPDCGRSLKDCTMLTSNLLHRYRTLRYEQKFLRSGTDIVDRIQEYGGWRSGDKEKPTGVVCLERSVCLCFGKLMACLSIKRTMRNRVVNSLRSYESGTSVWSGKICTPGDRGAGKKLAVFDFLEETLTARLSEVPTNDRREISPLCLREVHLGYQKKQEVEASDETVSYGYFCALFKRWLLDTNTSIRKHKTVEGCCADCVKYEEEIARCKQQNDALGVAQWKLERAAHAKEVVALKQRYYGVYTGPCFTCAAWR